MVERFLLIYSMVSYLTAYVFSLYKKFFGLKVIIVIREEEPGASALLAIAHEFHEENIPYRIIRLSKKTPREFPYIARADAFCKAFGCTYLIKSSDRSKDGCASVEVYSWHKKRFNSAFADLISIEFALEKMRFELW